MSSCALARSLCSLLSAPEVELIFAVLEALSAALDAGETASSGANRCAQLVEEAGGCERLEALQMHDNHDVYAKATEMLDAYFNESDAEDQQIVPVANGDSFSFAVPAGGGVMFS